MTQAPTSAPGRGGSVHALTAMTAEGASAKSKTYPEQPESSWKPWRGAAQKGLEAPLPHAACHRQRHKHAPHSCAQQPTAEGPAGPRPELRPPTGGERFLHF